MKSERAIKGSVPAWGFCLLFLLCSLWCAAPAMGQSPVRIINPAGGETGDPGLRIEIYADGSYHIYRDGKRETYEGEDKMNWEASPHTIRGPQAYVALTDGFNTPPDPKENNLIALHPSWVSPVYGNGTAGNPWKVQIMGKAHQHNYRSGPTDFYYTIILEYVKNNNYFYTNYQLYFTNGDLVDSDIYVFQTERVVMGADPGDLTALANSECVIGYKSGEADIDGPSPAVVAAYRNTSCSPGIPAPRSHVLKMNGGSDNGSQQRFRSYFVGNETSRMTLQNFIVQYLPNNMQTAPAASTYAGISVNKFFNSFAGDNKWEWVEDTTDGYHHPSIATRILTGYGLTPNDFDATPVGNAPTTFNSEPARIGFLKPSIRIAEGNSGDVQYTGNMLYITKATALLPMLTADLMLEVDGVTIPAVALDGCKAATAADYKLSDGTLIKAFNKQNDTIKIPLDAFFITGNNILQYDRVVKLKLRSNHGLLQVDGDHDTCRVIIPDDEPRNITLTPLTSTIREGDHPVVRAALPVGVTASAPLSLNLHLTSLAHTTGFSIPATAVIPAGEDHIDFILTTLADNIIEKDDTLHISADGQIMGQNGASSTDAVFILKDGTHTVPANMQLTLGPATATVDKGLAGQVITVSLPPGITTAVPISVTLTRRDTSTADPSSYDVPLNLRIDSGETSGSLLYQTRLDSLVYGPLVKHLVLRAAANDSIGNAYTVLNDIDLGIRDKNWPLAHEVIVGRTAAAIDEGGGSATLWVGLPDGLVAGRDFAFAISTSSDLTNDRHILNGLPADSVYITTGHSLDSVAVISTPDDGIEGNDETVTFTAAANNLPIAYNGSTTLHIVDRTIAGPPPALVITAVSNILEEGQGTDLKIALDNSRTLNKPLQVTLSLADGATAAGDVTLNTVTVILPAHTNNVTIPNAITANSDAIIEGNERFYINATATGAPVNIIPDTLTITDKTRLTAAQTALIISTPAMPAAWTKGDTRAVTIGLPAGVSTQVPISIHLAAHPTSGIGMSGLGLPAMPLKINPGTTSVTFNIQVATDLEVYGPLTRHLRLDGVVTDDMLPAGAFEMDSIRADITDNNWPLLHPLSISRDTIAEGNGTYAAVITLPDGLKAGRDLDFNLTATSSLVAAQHALDVPAAVKINAGSTAAGIGNFTVPADAIIGNDEDVTFTAVYSGMPGNAADAPVNDGALHITDATATDPAYSKITLGSSAASVLEGQSIQLTASLGAGVTATHDIVVHLAANAISSAGSADYSLPASITIPAGSSSAGVTLAAAADNILEPAALLRIDGTSSGFTVKSIDVQVNDATHLDPANTVLYIVIDSSSIIKGHSTKVTISFVNHSITTAEAFNIAVNAAATSTAAAGDYNTLPATLQMPAGAGSASFILQTLDNNLNETAAELVLEANANGYTINNSNPLHIITITPLTVKIVKTQDAAEPATDGLFTVQLPAGTLAAADITVTLDIDNTGATANFVTPPRQVTIPAGAGSVSVPIVIKDDDILQGDGELTAIITAAASTSGNILADNTPAVMTITDDENAPAGPKAAARKLVIEKIRDARKPSGNGAFRVRFTDASLSVARDVKISYTASGDADAGADYQPLPGTVVIPAFQTAAIVEVTPLLNDHIFKDVTATFTLSQVSAAMKVNWKISDTAAFTNIIIRDNNGVPDTAMAVIGPNRWTDDTARNIRVHPALSPNGDGAGNEAMYVENINKFPENEVTLFNRWGATVFHTFHYDNQGNNFAGLYNVNGSGDVPEGTYYYIIIINDHGKRERYTGFVVIRR